MAANNSASKNKGGRPPYEASDKDRNVVIAMAAGGMSQETIAAAIGISEPTLRKHFRDELDSGGAKAHAMVVGNLFRQASKDDPRSIPAAIFWTKTRLGWREKTEIEHSGGLTIKIGEEFSGL